MKKLIKLADIRADQRAQPRTTLQVDKIGEYADDMTRGDEFPPLIVFHDGATYWLADGFHRFYAATTAEKAEFSCDVREGGLRDAILFSCSANASHGLRRTSKDKQRAVGKLLEDEEWSKWSDREIAKSCSVSDRFVNKIRKEVTANIRSETTYRTKHGTVTTMKIEPRPQPKPKPREPLPPAAIASHLQEIIRHLDQLPDPKDVVQRFPEDQWLSVPLSKLEAAATWMGELAEAWREHIKAKANAA